MEKTEKMEGKTIKLDKGNMNKVSKEPKEPKEPKETKETKRMSYDDLANVANQLNNQVRELYTKLQESNMVNMFKRLDYLFKVLGYSSYFPEEFVAKCSEEIVDCMTIPKEDNSNSPIEEKAENTEE